MHAVVPLARTVSSAWQQSCSRIPHLQFHISQHRARTGKLLRNTQFARREHKRSHSSFSPASDFDAIDTAPVSRHETVQTQRKALKSELAHNETNSETVSGAAAETTATQPVNVYDILQEGHPARIFFALQDPVIGESFVANAPSQIFEQAFCALDPDYFLKDVKSVHRHIDSALYQRREEHLEPRFIAVRSIDERLNGFTNVIDTLLANRHEAGHKLGLPVLRHTLKWAEVTGNLQLARAVLNELIPLEGLKPDLECYNSFLGAMAWSNTYSTAERYQLRVTSTSLAKRSRRFRVPSYAGHRTSPPDKPNSVYNSIRATGLRTFKQLIKAGFAGDEKTFCYLMVTLAREGDVDAIKSILKSVWNIDAVLLSAFDEEEVQSPTFYTDTSPLLPSNRLLSTIVHTFCINNDYSLAASLLDYTSRNYNLTISENVWSHLLMWAYALGKRATNQRRKQGLVIGQLARTKAEDLLALIEDEPYEIKPDIYMTTLAAQASQRAHRQVAIVRLRESAQILEDERTELSLLYDETLTAIEDLRNTAQWDGFLPASFYDVRNRFIKAAIEVESHRNMIVRTFRRILLDSDFAGGGKYFTLSCQIVPSLVDEFAQYLPQKLVYHTPTGIIELKSKVHRHIAIENANAFQIARVSILRAALDTDDHAALLQRITTLPAKLSTWNESCTWCNDTAHTGQECGWRQTVLEGSTPISADALTSQQSAASKADKNSQQPWDEEYQETGSVHKSIGRRFRHLDPPSSTESGTGSPWSSTKHKWRPNIVQNPQPE